MIKSQSLKSLFAIYEFDIKFIKVDAAVSCLIFDCKKFALRLKRLRSYLDSERTLYRLRRQRLALVISCAQTLNLIRQFNGFAREKASRSFMGALAALTLRT